MQSAYTHAFNLIPGMGPVSFKKLRAYFSKISEAWQAPLLELKRAGLEEKLAKEIIKRRSEIDPQKEMEKLQKLAIKILTIADKAYPRVLKEIYAPPALLYVRGNLPPPEQLCLSIVGTRKPTRYGRQVTFQLVGLLAQTKLSIVSGLALGIDALTHQACLDFGGHTVAVLGSGVDDPSIYPRTNFRLAQKIIKEKGALISEYPPGTQAQKHFFPMRNRIIAGLSQGVLVIEAGDRSGTFITARAALEQNREIFAIPGSIYNPYSRGTNRLIQMGAKLVATLKDILDELNLSEELLEKSPKKRKKTSEEETRVCKYLSSQPLHIDALTKKCKMPPAQTSTLLTLLEMKGMVRNVGGGNYVLV